MKMHGIHGIDRAIDIIISTWYNLNQSLWNLQLQIIVVIVINIYNSKSS